MSKEFVMNGEIFLRNGADTYKSRKALHEVEKIIKKLEEELEKEESDELLFLELEEYMMIRDNLEENKMQLDDLYIDEFYVLITNGVDFQLESSKHHLNESDYRIYHDKSQMTREFTSLIDFLNTATFVGRKFRRLKPIVTDGIKDYSYTDLQLKLDGEVIVLYAMQDLFLVKDMSKMFGTRYELIRSKYTLDNNYEFYGKVYNEYADMGQVYKEISIQLSKEKTKKLTR